RARPARLGLSFARVASLTYPAFLPLLLRAALYDFLSSLFFQYPARFIQSPALAGLWRFWALALGACRRGRARRPDLGCCVAERCFIEARSLGSSNATRPPLIPKSNGSVFLA